jgi:hypothetical protein
VAPDNGEVVRRVVFPDAVSIALDRFEDGRLFTISKGGDVRRYSPALQ